MHLIVTMAGSYRRFREAGYSTPKYLLPWRGHSTLYHVLSNLLADHAFDEILLVANHRDVAYRQEIETEAAACGIGPSRIAFIGDTSGQATTGLIGIELLEELTHSADRRVVFHNIDTIVMQRDLVTVGELLRSTDGWIDCFPSGSPAFSYVRFDRNGMVSEIAEKRVISDHATSGLYAFADMDRYRRLVQDTDPACDELYISDVYRAMIAEGARIACGLSLRGQTMVLGTPAQYEKALESEQRYVAEH